MLLILVDRGFCFFFVRLPCGLVGDENFKFTKLSLSKGSYPNVPTTSLHVICDDDVGAHLARPKSVN